ncbi:MAG: hypothetical protein HW416_3550 [Chloroflexi bacterium]|nr:hypothetical protein [Chloroflexota bacterium]
MPNGRSGGFAIKRIDLEQLLLSVPPVTVIGTWFARSGPVSAAEASHALKDKSGESLGVEEQDHLDYIIHVGGTETWIYVTPDTALYAELRHHHKQWLERMHGK